MRGQYESQLEGLRAELSNIRGPTQGEVPDRGGDTTEQRQYRDALEKLGEGLAKEEREQLESLVAEMDKDHQQEIAQIQEKHVVCFLS